MVSRSYKRTALEGALEREAFLDFARELEERVPKEDDLIVRFLYLVSLRLALLNGKDTYSHVLRDSVKNREDEDDDEDEADE